MQVPAAFANQAQAGLSTDEGETFWWHGFQDPILLREAKGGSCSRLPSTTLLANCV